MPFQRIMRQVAREAKARPDDAFGGQPACIMSAYNRLNLISAPTADLATARHAHAPAQTPASTSACSTRFCAASGAGTAS